MGSKTRKKAHRNKTIKRGGATQRNIIAATQRVYQSQHDFDIRRRLIEEKNRQTNSPVNDLFGLTEKQIEAAAAAMPLVKTRPPSAAMPLVKPSPFTEESLFYESRPRILAIIEGIVGERARERAEHPFIERMTFRNPLKTKEEYLIELRRINLQLDEYGWSYTPKQKETLESNRDTLTERLQLIDAQIASEPNTYAHPNFVELGVGASKKASRRRVANGWAYLNVAPKTNNSVTYAQKSRPRTYVPRSRRLKTRWEEDFDFSLVLVRGFADYFPEVQVTEVTDLSLKFRKQLCEQVKKSNLDKALLSDIIHRSVALMDEGGVFTFDLKPPNVGILNEMIVFIDFEANTSFWLKVGCIPSEYKSAMILILLSYYYHLCLSDKLTKEDLRELAFEFVPNKPSRLFDKGYRIQSDDGIDLSINQRVAPSFTDYQTPFKILEAYTTIRIHEDGTKDTNLREILPYFGLTPTFFGLLPK
jgi:hypothetical protein